VQYNIVNTKKFQHWFIGSYKSVYEVYMFIPCNETELPTAVFCEERAPCQYLARTVDETTGLNDKIMTDAPPVVRESTNRWVVIGAARPETTLDVAVRAVFMHTVRTSDI